MKIELYQKIAKSGVIKKIDNHSTTSRNYAVSFYETLEEVPWCPLMKVKKNKFLEKLEKIVKIIKLAGPQNHNQKIIYTNRSFNRSKGFCLTPTRARTHAPRLTAICLTT